MNDTTNAAEPLLENTPNKITATQNGRQWLVEIEGILGIRDVKSLKRSLQVAVNHQRRMNTVSRINARSVKIKELSGDS